LIAAGPATWETLHSWVRSVAPQAGDEYRYGLDDVTLHLPFQVADYVDFYASEAHASNVGKIFRPNSPDLPASWRHLPIGYHGRAGTVVVSGTEVVRPSGQRRPGDDGIPGFGPSLRLDIECEVGFVVGTPSRLGEPVRIEDAADHIFGIVLLNDWSARDIQAWEYVPLGPFLGKSFATSISAWVTPLSALTASRVPLPGQEPAVLAYLAGDTDTVFGLDLELSVAINGEVVTQPHYRDMYWSPTQMLAHMTVNGASLRVGDLFASGTVSGTDRGSVGSLLERSWNGAEPIDLPSGRSLTFLDDGDVVTISGRARSGDGWLALGSVSGRVVASR
jgi:fumarylacetoacetase